MALDFTSQWGAATWGASQWGGDDNSISVNVSCTSGVGIGATATCFMLAALAATSGVGLHAATNSGGAAGTSAGVGIHASATCVLIASVSANSGVGVHAESNAAVGVTATSGIGIHVASTEFLTAHPSATSGVGIHAASGEDESGQVTSGVGIHATATCTLTAARTCTSGVGIHATLPGPPQTVTIGTGIAISVSPGTPLVIGPPQLVTVATGPLISITPGIPTVAVPLVIPGPVGGGGGGGTVISSTGGPGFLQLFIANVDFTKYLIPMGMSRPPLAGGSGGSGSAAIGAGPVKIVSTTIGRATATFDLLVADGSGFVPRARQTVILQEFGKKIFAGCIKAASCDPLQPNFGRPIFHVSCADKSSICDGRVVIKTYVTGADLAATVLDVVTYFLAGEGITTQGVDVSGAMGTLSSDVVGNYQTVTQVFDNIAAQCGATWWVDMDGVLHFLILPVSPAAPFSINATSDNFRNLVSTESTIGWANTFYAVSNLKVLPGFSAAVSGVAGGAIAETYTFINEGGQPWQQKAFDLGLAPGYVALGLPIQTLVSVSINGVPKAIFPISQGVGSAPGYYWFDGIHTAGVIFPENFLPSIGDVIVVHYIPVYQTAAVNVATPTLPPTPPTGTPGTCGSGVVEGVIQAPNIQFQGQLDGIAAAYQAKNGTIPFIVNFDTDLPGLAVGQALPCDLPLVGLGATTLYITGVTFTRGVLGGSDLSGWKVGKGSTFRCHVEASTQQNLGNWLTWFESLVNRTRFPLPLDRFESANFVLAPGTSLAGGAQNVNPYIVQRAGLLYAAVGAAGVAPTGQDLLIDFLVNGVSVFGGDITKMLKIPAGSVAKQTASVFYSPGLFVFKGDLITATAQYSVLTGSPVAAQSVSANLQWSF